MALISDAIERFHQLCDLHHRVVRRHPWAGMPENGGNRFFPNVSLPQPHSHGVPQIVNVKV